MVHFGSLVESQEKFKCIEIMTQESFDFRLKSVKSEVRSPNCPTVLLNLELNLKRQRC